MSQTILNECLNIFERICFPTILPDPKYTDTITDHLERQVMINAGLNFKVEDQSDIGRAVFHGNYQLFRILIKVRNIVNFNTYFEGESRWSLIHFAMFGRKQILKSIPSMTLAQLNQHFNHIKIAQYLIDNGLYINIQSKWGFSALHESILNDPDLHFAEFLLKNGADPNMKSIFGETPLHSAVLGSYIESIRLLCQYGADPRIKCALHGITALYLGRLHFKISAILNNTIRKLHKFGNSEIKNIKLECENVSFCAVCNVSSKTKKLYQCSKCRDYNSRYCSVECQRIDYKTHAINCYKNKRKMDGTQNGNELIFIVGNAQSEIISHPRRKCQAIAHQMLSKHFLKLVSSGEYPTDMDKMKNCIDKYNQKLRKKMAKESKKYKKQIFEHIGAPKANINEIVLNWKFIIKVQTANVDAITKYKLESLVDNKLLVYNKKRTYMVFIEQDKQRKQFNKLSKMIERISATNDTIGGKAYFYGWIDFKHKLHVLIDKVLALQPW